MRYEPRVLFTLPSSPCIGEVEGGGFYFFDILDLSIIQSPNRSHLPGNYIRSPDRSHLPGNFDLVGSSLHVYNAAYCCLF